MRFQGKTALVTGSSRGIGQATAMRLASEGALVALQCSNSVAEAKAVRKQIEADGGQAFVLQGDVGSLADVRRMADELASELKRRTGSDRLDILVNNAGVSSHLPLKDVDDAACDRVMGVNFRGPMFMAQALVDRMNDGGRIINVSSGTTRGAYPAFLLYTASKAALENLTRNLAVALGPRGITVNSVSPGVTDTALTQRWVLGDIKADIERRTPLGRIGRPEDVGDVIVFLASDDGRWVTGENIGADGGINI